MRIKPNDFSTGGVLQWMDHLRSPTPGVQVSERGIADVIARHFPQGPPSRIPFTFIVVVMDKGVKISSELGKLRRVSPCEQA